MCCFLVVFLNVDQLTVYLYGISPLLFCNFPMLFVIMMDKSSCQGPGAFGWTKAGPVKQLHVDILPNIMSNIFQCLTCSLKLHILAMPT